MMSEFAKALKNKKGNPCNWCSNAELAFVYHRSNGRIIRACKKHVQLGIDKMKEDSFVDARREKHGLRS